MNNDNVETEGTERWSERCWDIPYLPDSALTEVESTTGYLPRQYILIFCQTSWADIPATVTVILPLPGISQLPLTRGIQVFNPTLNNLALSWTSRGQTEIV